MLTRRLWKLLHDEARKKIEGLLGEIKFEGHFNIVFDRLSLNRQKQLIEWLRECKDGKVASISSDRITGLLAFILKFRQTNFRAVLTKKKNEYFIALFLGKHKYYENEKRRLGI